MKAAVRGGMKPIGFLTEWNNKEELRKADMIVDGFEALSYQTIAQMFL